MLTILQNGEQWELRRGDEVLSTHATYALALAELVQQLVGQLQTEGEAPTSPDGLLPETWRADMAFSEPTGDGRDFTNCVWSSRDPAVSTMPLMLQTCTEMGHFGAELAGFITEIALGDAPTGRGRFYDSETGRQARDMLLDGRRFGVSVDPGAVEAQMICDVMDDDGWCEEGHIDFSAYEIIGLTQTPFPGFALAFIELETSAAQTAPEGEQSAPAVAASVVDGEMAMLQFGSVMPHGLGTSTSGNVTVPARPRAASLTRPAVSWFAYPALLMPTPLTITNEGHVLGHVAAWGTCHVGSDRVCITPPNSQLDYRHFRTGEVVCNDGTHIPTGALTWGIPHADLNASLIAAQAHYADSRHGWADVNIGEDEFGIWIAGALRPGVTDEDLRVLRALALSGDWRRDNTTRALELVAALAVNVPGFPIPRAVVASGMSIEQPRMRAGIGAGMEQTALVASGIVLPEQFSGLTREPCGCDDSNPQLDRIERQLAVLDRRTRHLTSDAIEHMRGRFDLPEIVQMPPAAFMPRAHR